MSKLYAILHDGTFDGDNEFYCPDPTTKMIEFKDQTLRELKSQFWSALEDQMSREEAEEEYQVKGAWIVNKETISVLNTVWDCSPGNDSAVYICNHIAKRLADKLAVKKLGKKVRYT